jgi:hypothetical protein
MKGLARRVKSLAHEAGCFVVEIGFLHYERQNRRDRRHVGPPSCAVTLLPSSCTRVTMKNLKASRVRWLPKTQTAAVCSKVSPRSIAWRKSTKVHRRPWLLVFRALCLHHWAEYPWAFLSVSESSVPPTNCTLTSKPLSLVGESSLMTLAKASPYFSSDDATLTTIP